MVSVRITRCRVSVELRESEPFGILAVNLRSQGPSSVHCYCTGWLRSLADACCLILVSRQPIGVVKKNRRTATVIWVLMLVAFVSCKCCHSSHPLCKMPVERRHDTTS